MFSPASFAARQTSANCAMPAKGIVQTSARTTSPPSCQAVSIAEYFNTMLDTSMDWSTAAAIREQWGGTFVLKGVMSVADARRAVEIGADGIMLSNHGGRQLDGSRSPFDQLEEIVDAVGGEIEIICDGGVRRGTHALKALCTGATAASGGRLYLYALAAAGQHHRSGASPDTPAPSTPHSARPDRS